MKKTLYLLIIIFTASFISACQSKEERAVGTFYASDFKNLYSENSFKFSVDYEDKYVIIEGIVESFSGNKDEVEISLFGFGYGYIEITKDVEDLLDLEKYDYIKVVGKVSLNEGILVTPYLIDAELITLKKELVPNFEMSMKQFEDELHDNWGSSKDLYNYKVIKFSIELEKAISNNKYYYHSDHGFTVIFEIDQYPSSVPLNTEIIITGMVRFDYGITISVVNSFLIL